MCHNIIDEQIGSEDSRPLDSFDIPDDINNTSIVERAELLVTVFHSFFFDQPNRSYEQKLAIFNHLLEIDYLITERDQIRANFLRNLHIYFDSETE